MLPNNVYLQSSNEKQVKEGDGDPCWDSHKQVGMKKKGAAWFLTVFLKTKNYLLINR